MLNKEEQIIQIFDQYFGNQISWMCAGIEATLGKKETYHTCALALSTYTEILGGLVTGNLKEIGNTRKNYEAFLPYLGKEYEILDNKIKSEYPDRLKNLFSAVRSKLVHEFALRESHFVVNVEKPRDNKIGLELLTHKTEIAEMIHINFLLAEYYRDFKQGIETYKKALGKSDELFVKFLNALKDFDVPTENTKNRVP